MNAQAAAIFAMADDELTALVIEKLAGLPAEEAATFQDAQSAWRSWRTLEAEWESEVWKGGSIRPLMISTKMEQLTRERIASIQLTGDLERNPNSVHVPYKRTPQDLADHLEPGITGTRVREILGTPHFMSGPYWYYRFQEAQLELHMDGEVVEEVTFAMVDGEKYQTSITGFGPFTFGELTFGALQEFAGQALEIKHRTSMRTAEIYTTLRLGSQGAWSDFYFGALIPYSGAGKLMNTDFNWDWENRTLKDFPCDTIINWFGQTHNVDDAPAIGWFLR